MYLASPPAFEAPPSTCTATTLERAREHVSRPLLSFIGLFFRSLLQNSFDMCVREHVRRPLLGIIGLFSRSLLQDSFDMCVREHVSGPLLSFIGLFSRALLAPSPCACAGSRISCVSVSNETLDSELNSRL